MTNPWQHGELVNEGKLFDEVTARIDALGDNADWVNITNVNAGYDVVVWQFCIKNNSLIVRGRLTRGAGAVAVNDLICGLGVTLPTSLYRIPFQSNAGSGFMSVDTAGVVRVSQVTNPGADIIAAQTVLPLN